MRTKNLEVNLKKPNNYNLISISFAPRKVDDFLVNSSPTLPMPFEPNEHKERKDGYPSPDDDFDTDAERDIPLRESIWDLAAA